MIQTPRTSHLMTQRNLTTKRIEFETVPDVLDVSRGRFKQNNEFVQVFVARHRICTWSSANNADTRYLSGCHKTIGRSDKELCLLVETVQDSECQINAASVAQNVALHVEVFAFSVLKRVI
jgi:hypothetical protein